VIGSFDDADGDAVAELYRTFDARICRTDVASAEMIKYASNAFLATKISFINEIANVCDQTGADVVVVAEGMGLDERIGKHFLNAGLGYGGSCFPKDVAALKQLAGNSGYHFQLLNAVIEVNEMQKRRILTKLVRLIGPLRGKRIALRLLAEGAYVRAWDPVALDEASRVFGDDVELCADVLTAADGADAAIVVTEWAELGQIPLHALRDVMRQPLIVDGRNALDPGVVRAAGFAYEAVGRPAHAAVVSDASVGGRQGRPRVALLQAEAPLNPA
jgi:UDPglucose 6-dehydrogenase